ncbi:MAG: hypothetical protein ABIU87_12160, partial [Ornithinibacter sp.]
PQMRCVGRLLRQERFEAARPQRWQQLGRRVGATLGRQGVDVGAIDVGEQSLAGVEVEQRTGERRGCVLGRLQVSGLRIGALIDVDASLLRPIANL